MREEGCGGKAFLGYAGKAGRDLRGFLLAWCEACQARAIKEGLWNWRAGGRRKVYGCLGGQQRTTLRNGSLFFWGKSE